MNVNKKESVERKESNPYKKENKMETAQEIFEIVELMNCEIEDQVQDSNIYFEYKSNGFAHLILFLGIQFWNSDDDERETIVEDDDSEWVEPLGCYLRRMANELLSSITDLKFNIDMGKCPFDN